MLHFARRILIALALVNLSQNALSDPTPESTEQLLPARLGATELKRKQQLQPETLGTVFQYTNGRQLWGTIFVFDFGVKNISASLSDQTVLGVYAHAEEEIDAVVRLGRFKAARIPTQAPRLIEPTQCGRPYLRKDLEIDDQQGTTLSYLVLTTARGKFVKVRLTHPIDDVTAKAGVEAFFEDLSRALGECR